MDKLDNSIDLRGNTCKLPMEVSVDRDDNVQIDFPFNGKALSTKEKKALSNATLIKSAQ